MANFESEPESFLNYHQAWIDGDISLPELLAIPRRPEVIGKVPNPDEFEYFSAKLSGRNINDTLHNLITGGHAEALGFSFMLGCGPTLVQMIDHAEAHGKNPLRDDMYIDWSYVSSEDYTDEKTQETLRPHLDYNHQGRKVSLSYIVSARKPTSFYIDQFALPEGLDLSNDEQRHQAMDVLASQVGHTAVWNAKPFEIVAFDGTLPHAADALADGQWRALMRARNLAQ